MSRVSPHTRPTSERVPGARAVVDALVAVGVTHAFCVPGESFLGLLDALYDEPRIRLVSTRHEGGASFMAEAYARLTHRPAVCLGTRMVGGGNLAIGIHSARQDSSPVIALFGQVSTSNRHREAFQEAELAQVFAPLTKWAVEPPAADRLGELTLRAGRIAISGRPGPVAIALREDLLAETVDRVAYPTVAAPRAAPDPGSVREALALLRSAARPILLLGGGVLAANASALFQQIAMHEQVPVIAAWRRQDVFPNDHPLYLGQSGLGAVPSVLQRLREADVLFAVGTRLNEYTTADYMIPGPETWLVHVSAPAEELGGIGVAALVIPADPLLFGEAFFAAAQSDPPSREHHYRRAGQIAAHRAQWEAQTTPTRGKARAGFVDQQAVAAYLRDVLTPDTITVTDAGNFSGWPGRYLRWQQPGTFLGPTSGAMGYGVPAAIAARLARPDQPIVGFVGDGGFLMTGSELETAVRERLAFVLLVYDNAQYGTIRMHQMREYPGRRVATQLGGVDMAHYAEALGALGITVRDNADFPGAFEAARHSQRPAVLHLSIDPEQISVASDA